MISIKTLTWLSKAPTTFSLWTALGRFGYKKAVLFVFFLWLYVRHERSQTRTRTVFKRSSATQCGRKRACDP
jgi:hypothetical protein